MPVRAILWEIIALKPSASRNGHLRKESVERLSNETESCVYQVAHLGRKRNRAKSRTPLSTMAILHFPPLRARPQVVPSRAGWSQQDFCIHGRYYQRQSTTRFIKSESRLLQNLKYVKLNKKQF
jgi:hypothetical protein